MCRIHATLRATRFEVLDPIRQGVHDRFGGYAQDIAVGRAIRRDHGSQFLSRYYQDELRFLGAQSSPAYVREPEGSGVAERFIRTRKEQLLWVERFHTVAELLEALHAFKERYTREWLLAKHRHRSPAQARALLNGEVAA